MRTPAVGNEVQAALTQATLTVALLTAAMPILYRGWAAEAATALLLGSFVLVLPFWFIPRPNTADAVAIRFKRYPFLAVIATVFWLVLWLSALALLDLTGLTGVERRLLILFLTTGSLLWVIDAWLTKANANGPAALGQLIALGGLAWCWHLHVTPPPEATTVVLHLPWDRPTRVLQGGPSPLHNRHFFVTSTQNALDLAVEPPPRGANAPASMTTEPPSWDEPVLAPADGEVVQSADGDPDGTPGTHGTFGNQVILQLAPDRFLLLGHLRQGSVLVHVGDHVRVGDVLGHCGASGDCPTSHLHLQAMDLGNLRSAACTTLPIRFAGVSGDPFARKGALLRNLP